MPGNPPLSDELKATINAALVAIDAATKALAKAKAALAAVSNDPGGGAQQVDN